MPCHRVTQQCPQRRLHAAEASHASVKAMKEELGGSMIGCELGDVLDGQIHLGMGVVLQSAATACPAAAA
jgi:hypothetical protein